MRERWERRGRDGGKREEEEDKKQREKVQRRETKGKEKEC